MGKLFLIQEVRRGQGVFRGHCAAAESGCAQLGSRELGLALVHLRALIRSSGFAPDAEVGRPEREAADKHEAKADGGDTYQRPDLRRRRGG